MLRIHPSVADAAQHLLIVDQEGWITGAFLVRDRADKRAKELDGLALAGPHGMRRSFRVIEVDADAHAAATMRRLVRWTG